MRANTGNTACRAGVPGTRAGERIGLENMRKITLSCLKFIFLAAFLCLAAGLPARAAPPLYGNIYGTVTDAQNQRPLSGVEITVTDQPLERLSHPSENAINSDNGGWIRLPEKKPVSRTRSGSQGKFLINSLPVPHVPAPYTVILQAEGYGTLVLEKTPLLPGAVMALKIEAAMPAAGTVHISRGMTDSDYLTVIYRHQQRSATASARKAPPENLMQAAAADDPLKYTIFATREGLVGGTTANGHVIVENDHFVALPSRTVLCSKNGREYEVRLEHNGHSETAPVWDIGPWNIHDNYWAPEEERQIYEHLSHGGESGGLGRGLPQAQAAYESNFNSGRDEYGRRVVNPAGIDLADGTFWYGLNLSDNAWITVEYLWLESDGDSDAEEELSATCFIRSAR